MKNGLSRTHTSENGTLTKERAGEQGSWFASYTTRRGSFFSVYKEYNSKGYIRKKWVSFRNGSAIIGTRYEFNDEGRLCLSKNEDENFSFTRYDVIRYCQNNHIDLLNKDFQYVERYSDLNTLEFSYIIHHFRTFENKSGRISIILNGKTGDVEEILLENPNLRKPEIIFTSKIIPEKAC